MTFERTGMGKVVCPLCRYTWTTDEALRNHLRKPHQTCPECGAQRVGMAQHMRHAHPAIKEAPEQMDRYVGVELKVFSKAPKRGAVVELLQSFGAHLGAQEEIWVVAVDSESCRSVARVAVGEYHHVQVSIPALLTVPLLAGADRIVLAHNHPSGRLLPSQEDFDLTDLLVKLLNDVGMVLEDHLILAPDERYMSFRDANVLIVPERTGPREMRA